MTFNVNSFRSQLEFGGARPTLFQVQIQNPVSNLADLKSSFMIKSAVLPESTMTEIPVGYFGRKIHVAGDRDFQPWTVSVINDEDFVVRNALERWSAFINSHEGNIQQFGTARPAAYKTQALVNQYSKDGSILRTYKFQGLFPTNIGAIQLDWDSQSQIETFDVTFQYDWWTVSGGKTGDAGTNA